MNELEEMLEDEHIPYLCVKGRYTLFTNTGLPILIVEKDNEGLKPEPQGAGYFIRCVNFQYNEEDVNYNVDRDNYCYHINGDANHVYKEYYYRNLDFAPLELKELS